MCGAAPANMPKPTSPMRRGEWYMPAWMRSTAVIDGPVVDSILDYIEGSNADLLIMTTHGRSGLKRWVYGSVTSKVLSGSKCSMLIIRPPQEELQ